jgi:hypothetical protein
MEAGPPDDAGVGARPVGAPEVADTLEAVVRTTPVGDGVAAVGALTEGVVAEGTVLTGVDTRGVVTEGTVTDGEGVVALGVVAEGVVTFGVVTVGVVPTGVLTDGTVTDGTVADGTVADGTVTVGTDRFGTVAATPASGCTTSTPSPAAAIPTTTLRRLPMAYPLRWSRPAKGPITHQTYVLLYILPPRENLNQRT